MAPLSQLAVVLLLALLNPGEGALKCHESTCLDEESLTACAFDNGTVLKECDVEVFREASRRMNRPLHRIITNLPMTCIKIEEEGLIGGELHKGVVRMCYLDLPNICRELQKAPTDMVEKQSQPLAVSCHVCNSDGCNVAAALGPTALLAAVPATWLVSGRL